MTLVRSRSFRLTLPLLGALSLAAACGDDDGGGGKSPSEAGAGGDEGVAGSSVGGDAAGLGGGPQESGGSMATDDAGAAGSSGQAGEASSNVLGWSQDFALPGINGATTSTVTSAVITGVRKLWVGGEFSQAGDVPAQNVAIWNGQRWSALGEGLSSVVLQLAPTVDEDMYALVEAPEGQSAIRFWDGESWAEVPAATQGGIKAIEVAPDGTLYAAGYFTEIGGVEAPGVAYLAPGGEWVALPNDAEVLGTGGISTVKLVGDDVCVGGLIGGGQVGAACFDGDDWLSYTANLAFGEVKTLTFAGGTLYASGSFMLDGVDTGGGVAAWNGESWELVGGGLLGSFGQPDVMNIAVDGEKVYATGFFALAGGAFVRHVAMWNGNKWSDLNGGLQKFLGVDFIEGPRGRTLAVDDGGEVYVGGRLTFAGAENAMRVARWDGADWHGVDDPLVPRLGVNGSVLSVMVGSDGDIYAGGAFEHLGGDALALGVARFAPSEQRWYGMGSGFERVDALAEYQGDIYAGGNFTSSGTASIKGVGRWDGAAWRSVSGGVVGEVRDLVAGPDAKLYVAGTISEAGGAEARNVVVWDGESWESLGVLGEEFDSVHTLAFDDQGTLYAGGMFTTADGVEVNRIATWKDGAWVPLGAGVDDMVDAIAFYDGKLVIGGWFSHSGDDEVEHIASWDPETETWQSFGGGLVSPEEFGTVVVTALAVRGTDLYAAGIIKKAGEVEVSHLARFDGESWHDVDGGLDDTVETLSLAPEALWVGGTFTRAGGVGSIGIARFGLAP
jgi:hypothetical protein